MGQGLSAENRQQAQEAFNLVDVNHNGTISFSELRSAIGGTERDLKRQILKVDKDGNRQLNFEEFMEFMDLRISPVFSEIDKDGNGYVSSQEFIDWLQKYTIRRDEAERFVAENGGSKGSITKFEFGWGCHKLGLF
eukprot:TRINITY_DN2893_c0_g1_i1.p1 TRINITY_DN2893_c0_g1~~TRINITY_DN2893_c0_g1_i1.p1  ORF type:complete len:136 (+),score=22.52 TRINITY_DN2893_c0_g1_i1:75-482(+)